MERKRMSARGGSSSAKAQRGGRGGGASAGRGSGSSGGSKRVVLAWADAMRDSDDSDDNADHTSNTRSRSGKQRKQSAQAVLRNAVAARNGGVVTAAAAVAPPVAPVAANAQQDAPAKAKKTKKAKAKKPKQPTVDVGSVHKAASATTPTLQSKTSEVAASAQSDPQRSAEPTPVISKKAAKKKKNKTKTKTQQQTAAPAATASSHTADNVVSIEATQRAAKKLRKEQKRLAKQQKGVTRRADIDYDGAMDDDVAFASDDDDGVNVDVRDAASGSDSEFADAAMAAGFVLVDLETHDDEIAALADLASAGALSAKMVKRLARSERKQQRKQQQQPADNAESRRSDAVASAESVTAGATKSSKTKKSKKTKTKAKQPVAAAVAVASAQGGSYAWNSDDEGDERAAAATTDAQSPVVPTVSKKQRKKQQKAAAVESVAAVVATDSQVSHDTTMTTKKKRKKQKQRVASDVEAIDNASSSPTPVDASASHDAATTTAAVATDQVTDTEAAKPTVSKHAVKHAARLAAKAEHDAARLAAKAEHDAQRLALKTERRSERGRRNKHADASPAASNDAAVEFKQRAATSTSVFEEYVSHAAVVEGLERGMYFQGRLRVNARYRLDGYVTLDGLAIDVLVKGLEDRNRAFDGDVVAIELRAESEWKALSGDNDKLQPPVATAVDASKPSAPINTDKLHALWLPSVETSKCFVGQSSNDVAADNNSRNSNSVTTQLAAIQARAAALHMRPTAKVVHVLVAGNTAGFIGSLVPKTKPASIDAPLAADDAFAYFQAHDERLPRFIQIPRLQLPDAFVRAPLAYAQSMLCFCRVTTWSTKYARPKGAFVKTLGEFSGIDAGVDALLTQHDLLAHARDFGSDILDALERDFGASGEKWTIPADELAKRRDLRALEIFSIDPTNARDLDDALHIRALDAGRTRFEVGVHIADVTHFVTPGSALDREAQARATSVYLVHRVLPMLPRVLCEKLCSLQPQVDRLAFSVIWHMHADGTLVDDVAPWFGKSVIRSCCKLDYATAQRMLDGAITPDDVTQWESARRPQTDANAAITDASVIASVQDLWRVARARRTARFDTGAVSLNNVKLTFRLDEAGNPVSYGPYALKDSNRLVEEYMLLANYLVAQQLLRAHGPLAFVRHHAPPAALALEQALQTLARHDLVLDATSPKTLYDSLETLRCTKGELAFTVAQALLIKPMQPAEYVVAGTCASPTAWRHYALNIPYYTHFTSPIRRYADVVVHRLLLESLSCRSDASGSVLPVDDPTRDVASLLPALAAVAQTCNDKKLAAKHAETACDLVFLCAFVKHHGAVAVAGVVLSVGPQSFTVYVPALGLEERIAVSAGGGWTGEYDAATSRLTVLKRNKAASKKKRAQQTVITDDTAVTSCSIELAFMKTVRLEMAATAKMPLKLVFTLLGE